MYGQSNFLKKILCSGLMITCCLILSAKIEAFGGHAGGGRGGGGHGAASSAGRAASGHTMGGAYTSRGRSAPNRQAAPAVSRQTSHAGSHAASAKSNPRSTGGGHSISHGRSSASVHPAQTAHSYANNRVRTHTNSQMTPRKNAHTGTLQPDRTSSSFHKPTSAARASTRHPMNRSPSLSRAGQSFSSDRQLFTHSPGRDRVGGIGREALSSPHDKGVKTAASLSERGSAQRLASNWKQQWTDRSVQGQQIRNRVQGHYLRQPLNYRNQWWQRHGHYPYNAARYAGWAPLAGWLGWDDTPYYYEDGLAYYVPDDAEAAYDANPGAVSQVSYEGMQWFPLGFFVAVSGTASAYAPTWYLELVASRKGDLEGYLYNSTLETSQALTGSIDPVTQIASWQILDQENSPLFSTGVYNLTQQETPAQMQFPDGKTEKLLLVRIDSQEAESQ